MSVNIGIDNPDPLPRAHLSNQVNDEGEGDSKTFPVLDSIPVGAIAIPRKRQIRSYDSRWKFLKKWLHVRFFQENRNTAIQMVPQFV
ncbi:hypothetical protein CDAR_549651 [Caerostris darwini]|uniref:Uncharacterized protein n=1 Tax=Caerostris darwini TaxID=1538125 RepID=A0AAV4Q4P1_9ARAC|nr:hypothetical protein CDAR_549651 [Caerostris darwini]